MMNIESIATHELEAELERRKKAELERRKKAAARIDYKKRERLAQLIRDNREAFLEFFDLAGCECPVDVLTCLSDNWMYYISAVSVIRRDITEKRPEFDISASDE